MRRRITRDLCVCHVDRLHAGFNISTALTFQSGLELFQLKCHCFFSLNLPICCQVRQVSIVYSVHCRTHAAAVALCQCQCQ